MVSPQGDVLVSLRKCLCFLIEMCLFPQGNDVVSLGRCDCFPKENEVVHVIPEEMYSWNSSLTLAPSPGISWGHQLMDFFLLSSTSI
jgi:hypothetical protein